MTVKRTPKDLAIDTVVIATITAIVNLGLFVTWKEMTAYAAPKESMTRIENKLTRIEKLTIKLCMRQHIEIPEE